MTGKEVIYRIILILVTILAAGFLLALFPILLVLLAVSYIIVNIPFGVNK